MLMGTRPAESDVKRETIYGLVEGGKKAVAKYGNFVNRLKMEEISENVGKYYFDVHVKTKLHGIILC